MMLDAPLAPDADINHRSGPDADTRLKIIDGDVHPAPRALADLKPYMPARWWEYLQTYGTRRRHAAGLKVCVYVYVADVNTSDVRDQEAAPGPIPVGAGKSFQKSTRRPTAGAQCGKLTVCSEADAANAGYVGARLNVEPEQNRSRRQRATTASVRFDRFRPEAGRLRSVHQMNDSRLLASTRLLLVRVTVPDRRPKNERAE